ncbi:CoA-acylating methylmalonate-semialdehyde dehydrogenase [Carboxydochorda subterranea]|uniref:methylmalonate-semialdehyde dehydrogenase (CoA acylating) n=1 Tax=Carboxydichorda subterranea TaxID=3109565 RepID=A0ABZ1BUQ3_9FIRM|nr:CoA-acylating methylmalonate-semialdehyde dehydrogenase [Limnochorda sp. L945t]WRP16540.1 CoA-acylating methylmalonate-semialdehyde dehydrogenase [Limnochorda sp. L945t]
MVAQLIGGTWSRPRRPVLPVFNPATGEVIDEVPLSGPEEVGAACRAADEAFGHWSRTPVMERVRLMFRFKQLLEEHFEDLARIVTRHHGKTLDEARGEVRRGIEVVDFACGAPTLLQGRTLREVSRGVDQDYYRYPVGVVAGITPFNFPVMIPLWMFPLAVVAGNTFVLKPSERTPLGAVRLAELFLEAGFPPGVLNVVHGAREAVDALLEHPAVRAISFVGSEPVARYVYEQAARHGKRVQAAGGAKNHMIVLPDADLDLAVEAILNSAFGNAGERCLAGSVAVAVGDVRERLLERLEEQTRRLRVGPGDSPGVQVGPLIRADHRERVLGYIRRSEQEGARVVVDGRAEVERPGFFLGPTVLDGVSPEMAAGRQDDDHPQHPGPDPAADGPDYPVRA